MLKLSLRQVQTDRAGAEPGQRYRPLRSAATEFEDVATGDVAEDLQLRFGYLRRSPRVPAASRQIIAVSGLILVAVAVPHRPVAGGVVGQRGGVGAGVARHPVMLARPEPVERRTDQLAQRRQMIAALLHRHGRKTKCRKHTARFPVTVDSHL